MATRGYDALPEGEQNPFEENDPFRETDNEDDPHRIMIHQVPQTKSGRWSHVEDLDTFFTRVYNYHQQHGFSAMISDEFLKFLRLPFLFIALPFAFSCINFPLLSDDFINPAHNKTTASDIILTFDQCYDIFSSWWFYWYLIFPTCMLVIVFRLIKFLYHVVQYVDIKQFYNSALKISDAELDNFSWHDVQKRVLDVQVEQKICIHKDTLTELDLYHRMLRFENYLVAMMNKGLIPATSSILGLGEFETLSETQIYITKMILFWGPGSLFENNWHLKDEYKRSNRRAELSAKLARTISYISFGCFILSPILFIWELMNLVFHYADIIKRDPGSLGSRTWSLAGRLRLRHFNELNHELDARLNRAYRPAVKYMESFSDPLSSVFAHHAIYFLGAIFSIAICLVLVYDSLLQVEHIVTTISVFGAVLYTLRSCIPDENMVNIPAQLLNTVAAHVHYIPPEWTEQAHTKRIKNMFTHYFQLKVVKISSKLFSPVITPFVLWFKVRPKTLDIIDFFRNFTVSVIGVGDVCSFAQMDVRKHGNPDWQAKSQAENLPKPKQYDQAAEGKTELSLVHFTLTNPDWKMPGDAQRFVDDVKTKVQNDFGRAFDAQGNIDPNTTMGQSLLSLEEEYPPIVKNIRNTRNMSASFVTNSSCVPSFNYTQPTHSIDFQLGVNSTNPRSPLLQNISEDDVENDQNISRPTSQMRRMHQSMSRLRRSEGPSHGSNAGLLFSVVNGHRPNTTNPDFTAADMGFSAMFLRDMYLSRVRSRGIHIEQDPLEDWQQQHQEHPNQFEMPTQQSSTPLLPYPFGSSSMSSQTAAERTPLLTSKKS